VDRLEPPNMNAPALDPDDLHLVEPDRATPEL
jgi:hypothetical protein